MKKSASETDRIVGCWKFIDDDSTARFQISKTRKTGRLRVQAYDSSDGERMQVRQLRCVGKCVTFETITLSTGYHAKHKLSLMPNGHIRHELTLVEEWIRLDPESKPLRR